MKEKSKDNNMGENFFRAMNYELAGDIGAIDNDDMIHNRKLRPGIEYIKGNKLTIKKNK